MRALAALLIAAALLQDDRDDDPVRLPGEADRFYRLALWDRAEKPMRAEVAKEPTDKGRYGLVNVLYHARKYDECMRECELLAGTKDVAMGAAALALKGACSWKKGDADGARTWCAQALAVADAKAPNAFPAVRRSVRATQAFLEWKRYESKRFIILYPAASPLAADIAGFAARLDAAFEETAAAIESTLDEKIEAYYFTDQRQADDILGVPLSFASPRERAIYALPSAPLGHGLAHVLSFYVANRKEKERPKSAFLNEGLACAFSCDELWDRRIAEVPAALARQEKLPALAELLRRDESGVEFVATAGSFVCWLRAKEGAAKFVKLWTEYNDHADPWTAVYGKKLEEVEAAWRASLRK